LRGNDLVGVNVVAHHIHRPGKNGLHGMNVPLVEAVFNLKINPAFPVMQSSACHVNDRQQSRRLD
jgi:hypothetical protein